MRPGYGLVLMANDNKSKLARLTARAEKLNSQAAKSDLEKLFSESPLNKEKAAKIAEIKSLRGKADFYPKMNEYWEKFGVPLEWEVQQLFLDHRDVKIVREILAELKKTAPTMDLQKQEMLSAKLNVMELSTFDSGVVGDIREIKKSLLRI